MARLQLQLVARDAYAQRGPFPHRLHHHGKPERPVVVDDVLAPTRPRTGSSAPSAGCVAGRSPWPWPCSSPAPMPARSIPCRGFPAPPAFPGRSRLRVAPVQRHERDVDVGLAQHEIDVAVRQTPGWRRVLVRAARSESPRRYGWRRRGVRLLPTVHPAAPPNLSIAGHHPPGNPAPGVPSKNKNWPIPTPDLDFVVKTGAMTFS